MKKAEMILAAVGVTGILLYFFLIPGGNQLMIISISSLAVIYLNFNPLLFYDASLGSILRRESHPGVSSLKKRGALVAGFALSMTLIGILFKLMRWPGAEFLSAGLIAICAVLIVAMIKYSKTKSEFYARVLKRAIIIGIFGAVFMLISEATLLEMQYRNYPSYIDVVKKSMEEPGNDILRENVRKERERLKLE